MADGPISVKPKGQSSIVKQDNAPFESIKPHSKRRLNPDTTESAPSSAAASVQVDSAMKLDQEGFQSGDRKRGALKGWLRIGKRGSEEKRWGVLSAKKLFLYDPHDRSKPRETLLVAHIEYVEAPRIGSRVSPGLASLAQVDQGVATEITLYLQDGRDIRLLASSVESRDLWAAKLRGSRVAKAAAVAGGQLAGYTSTSDGKGTTSPMDIGWAKDKLTYAERSLVTKIFLHLDKKQTGVVSVDDVRYFSWDFLFELERLDPDNDGVFSLGDLLIAVAQVAELLTVAKGARGELKPMLALILRQVKGELSEEQLQARLDELDPDSDDDNEKNNEYNPQNDPLEAPAHPPRLPTADSLASVASRGTRVSLSLSSRDSKTRRSDVGVKPGPLPRHPSLEADLVRAMAKQMRKTSSLSIRGIYSLNSPRQTPESPLKTPANTLKSGIQDMTEDQQCESPRKSTLLKQNGRQLHPKMPPKGSKHNMSMSSCEENIPWEAKIQNSNDMKSKKSKAHRHSPTIPEEDLAEIEGGPSPHNAEKDADADRDTENDADADADDDHEDHDDDDGWGPSNLASTMPLLKQIQKARIANSHQMEDRSPRSPRSPLKPPTVNVAHLPQKGEKVHTLYSPKVPKAPAPSPEIMFEQNPSGKAVASGGLQAKEPSRVGWGGIIRTVRSKLSRHSKPRQSETRTRTVSGSQTTSVSPHHQHPSSHDMPPPPPVNPRVSNPMLLPLVSPHSQSDADSHMATRGSPLQSRSSPNLNERPTFLIGMSKAISKGKSASNLNTIQTVKDDASGIPWRHALDHKRNDHKKKSHVRKKITKLKVALIGDSSARKDKLMHSMMRDHTPPDRRKGGDGNDEKDTGTRHSQQRPSIRAAAQAADKALSPKHVNTPRTSPDHDFKSIKGSSKGRNRHRHQRTMSVGTILGMSMVQKELTFGQDHIDLSLFSLTGGDQYRHIMHVVLADAAVHCFVFSLVDPDSLAHIKTWYMRVHSHLRKTGSPCFATSVLVGTHYERARASYDENEWKSLSERARRYAKKAKASALIFCDVDNDVNLSLVLPVLLQRPLRRPRPPPGVSPMSRSSDSELFAPPVEWFE